MKLDSQHRLGMKPIFEYGEWVLKASDSTPANGDPKKVVKMIADKSSGVKSTISPSSS